MENIDFCLIADQMTSQVESDVEKHAGTVTQK